MSENTDSIENIASDIEEDFSDIDSIENLEKQIDNESQLVLYLLSRINRLEKSVEELNQEMSGEIEKHDKRLGMNTRNIQQLQKVLEGDILSSSRYDELTTGERMVMDFEQPTSATERRAVSLIDRYKEWSGKGTNGLVLNTAKDDVRRRLSAVESEELEWTQIRRVVKKVESLTEGKLEVDKNPNGRGFSIRLSDDKMLITDRNQL